MKATYEDSGMNKLLIFIFSILTFSPAFGQMTIDSGRGGTSNGGRATVIQDKNPTKTVKAKRYNLFVLGDEYSDANSLIQVIQYMGIQTRTPFEIAPSKITPQNCTLEMHLANTELPKAMTDIKWNFVVLQENRNALKDTPEKTIEKGTELASMVKKHGAKPVFFMNWAGKDSPEDSKEILKTYETLALENKCLMSPVGIAWERSMKIAPHIKLYRDETEISYPTAHGTYLTAACLFVTIFRQSPIGQKQTGFKTISQSDALTLQKIAYKTVMDYEKYIVNKAKQAMKAEGEK